MASSTDYYEVLQVSPNADAAVIDAAYQRLAQLGHSGHNVNDPSAGERMALLHEAHAVLTSVEKRREYDMAIARFTTGAMSHVQAAFTPRPATPSAAGGRQPPAPRRRLPLKKGAVIVAALVVVVLSLVWAFAHKADHKGSSTAGEDAIDMAAPPQQQRMTTVDLIDAALTGAPSGQGRAEASRQAPTDRSAEVIFAEASVAVVLVETYNRNSEKIGFGTGFLVSEDGLVATNDHVIRDAHHVRVTLPDGSKYPAKRIILSLRSRDLALIEIRCRKLPCLRLAQDALPEVGTKVYAIGNPLGLTNSLSDGLVSGHRKIDNGDTLIQTTAAISPGSSGGPLLSSRGEVVGVTTAFLRSGQNLNLAVPVRFLREALQELEWSHTVAKAEGPASRSADARLVAIIKKYLVEGMTQREVAELVQSFTNKSTWDSMQTYRSGELIPDFDHVVKPWRFEPYVTRYFPVGDSRGNATKPPEVKRPRDALGDSPQTQSREREGVRYRLNLLFIESRLRGWYTVPE